MKSFDVYGSGKDLKEAEKDLAGRVKDTAKALGVDLGTLEHKTEYQVMLRVGGESAIGTGPAYEAAYDRAVDDLGDVKGATQAQFIVTIAQHYYVQTQAKVVAKPEVTRGSGGGAGPKEGSPSQSSYF